MNSENRRIPDLPNLEPYYPSLAKMVAETSYLPDPGTVEAMGGAVFPTIRLNTSRVMPIEQEGVVVGMYDDNTTPRWALLFAHGIRAKGRIKGKNTGWMYAHVWPSGEDLGAYTHLANLIMIPECFGSLTDKEGPLTGYLRWHAWDVYKWKPDSQPIPEKPNGYDGISWRYFPPIESPKVFVQSFVTTLRCKRSKILHPLMGISSR